MFVLDNVEDKNHYDMKLNVIFKNLDVEASTYTQFTILAVLLKDPKDKEVTTSDRERRRRRRRRRRKTSGKRQYYRRRDERVEQNTATICFNKNLNDGYYIFESWMVMKRS